MKQLVINATPIPLPEDANLEWKVNLIDSSGAIVQSLKPNDGLPYVQFNLEKQGEYSATALIVNKENNDQSYAELNSENTVVLEPGEILTVSGLIAIF